MLEIEETGLFARWLSKLRDRQARARIGSRIQRLKFGNPGDVEPVGAGVSELRIDYGPGYRVYFFEHRAAAIMLLCGGDKDSQQRDIARAKRLAAEIRRQT